LVKVLLQGLANIKGGKNHYFRRTNLITDNYTRRLESYV